MKTIPFLLLAAGLGLAQHDALPKFEDYPEPERFTGKPAAPVFKTRGQRSYRTKIREGAAAGPNFAGHFMIAVWGCGTSCISGAIVDAKTGEIHDLPFSVVSFGSQLKFADGESSWSEKFEPLLFKPTS